MGKLSGQARYAGIVHFRVDYDRQKAVMKQFGVRERSTLVMFRGAQEVGRLAWETGEQPIRALLDKAL